MTGAPDNGFFYAGLSRAGRRLVSTVAIQLGEHLEDVRTEVDARILAEVPELAHASDELLDGLERSTRAHLTRMKDVMSVWADPRESTAPIEALEWGRDFVRHGLPIEALLRAYRIGHAVLSQFWSTALSSATRDAYLLAETSTATADYLFTNIEAVLQPIIDEYIAERERLARRAQSLGEAELRRILRGEPVDVRHAGDRLRYRLDRWHIGFIVWVPGAEADVLPQLDQAGARIARALDDDDSALIVAASSSVLHGWVGSWQRRAPAQFPTVNDVHIAVGEPAHGLDGFRRSHDQARHARRVARLSHVEPSTIAYRDCAVAAMLSADIDQARSYVSDVLGKILIRDDADRLLETVAIYQQEHLSPNRAAQRLHVHPNTVSYRIRRVLDASGETDAGSLRLRAAIALASLVGPPPSTP